MCILHLQLKDMFSIAFTLHSRNKFLNWDEYHLLTTFIALFCHMWVSALSAKFGTLCMHERNVFSSKCCLRFILINIYCSFCATATLKALLLGGPGFWTQKLVLGPINLTMDQVQETALVPFPLPSIFQKQSWKFSSYIPGVPADLRMVSWGCYTAGAQEHNSL